MSSTLSSRYTYTTQSAVRAAFWDAHPSLECRRGPRGRALPQNSQPVDTRAAFVEYVDALARNGEIGAKLADRVTL